MADTKKGDHHTMRQEPPAHVGARGGARLMSKFHFGARGAARLKRKAERGGTRS